MTKIEEHLTEMLLAFMLPIMIIFMLNFQYTIMGINNSFFIYLLLCIGEVGLAIMVNKGLLKEKKKEKK